VLQGLGPLEALVAKVAKGLWKLEGLGG